jgi:hypothetical protein
VTTSSGSGASASDRVILDELDIAFTPKFANSKVLITYMITGETSSHNAVWILLRDTTVIGRNSNYTNRRSGLAPIQYDGNDDTTPAPYHVFFVDSPGSTTAVTYRIAYQPSSDGVVTRTFALNRSLNGFPGSEREAGISLVTIMEIAQ